MFLIALWAAANATAAQPIGDPRVWITNDVYPQSALAASAEGTVRTVLSIAASGEITGCTVERSSGHPDLDAATCTLFRQRAKFLPARNAAGVAIASQTVRQVRWVLPRETLISRGFRMTYGLNTEGQVTGCKIAQFGPPDPDLTCFQHMIEPFARSHLKEPLGRYNTVSLLLAMKVGDDTGVDRPRPQAAEHVVLAQSRVRVSAAGAIIDCVTDKVAEVQGVSMDMCKDTITVGKREFDADPAEGERSVTVSFELIGQPR